MEFTKNFSDTPQVLKFLKEIRKNEPTLTRLALANGIKGLTSVDATKIHFKDSVYTNITARVTDGKVSGYFNTTPKELKVENTKMILVGDSLEFKSGLKALYLEVVEKVDATTLKVVKEDGEDMDISTGSVLLVTSTTEEGAPSTQSRKMRKERTNFNFSQIVKLAHEISKTEVDTKNYTTNRPEAYVISEALKRWEDFVDNTLLSVRRNENGAKRYMGGLPYFIGNVFNEETGERIGFSTQNRINLQGQKLSKEVIGDMFEYISNQGGSIDSVVCSTHVLRQLSDLENNKVYVSMNPNQGTIPKKVGGAIDTILNPIISGTSGDIVNYIPNNKLGDTVIFFKKENFGAQMMKTGLDITVNQPGDSELYKGIVRAELMSYYFQGQETGFIFENVA